MEADANANEETLGRGPQPPKRNPRLFALYVFCGLSIQPFSLVYLQGIYKLVYLIANPLVFLVIALILRRKEHQKQYFPICFAFFIGSLATSLNQIIYSGGPGSTVMGKVVIILLSTILVVAIILTLNKVSGQDLGSIYLQKGDLRKGILIGSVLCLVFLLTAVPAAIYIFGANEGNLTPENLLMWTPWIAAFVILNGIREEIWFRGIYLRKFESHLGADPANYLQAIIFSLAHFGGSFGVGDILNLVIFFFLGLGFGALMQKTDSVIGSIIFHAGVDIPVMIMAFSTVPLF
jgi:membrane protease YdiL (CAAX protease family)